MPSPLTSGVAVFVGVEAFFLGIEADILLVEELLCVK